MRVKVKEMEGLECSEVRKEAASKEAEQKEEGLKEASKAEKETGREAVKVLAAKRVEAKVRARLATIVDNQATLQENVQTRHRDSLGL